MPVWGCVRIVTQVDWYSGSFGGYRLKEDVIGYLGDVRSNVKSVRTW